MKYLKKGKYTNFRELLDFIEKYVKWIKALDNIRTIIFT